MYGDDGGKNEVSACEGCAQVSKNTLTRKQVMETLILQETSPDLCMEASLKNGSEQMQGIIVGLTIT